MSAALDKFRQDCWDRGLDLVAPFPVGRYNQIVPAPFQIPDFGNPRSLACVVGNTKRLWPLFLRAIRSDRRLMMDSDPLDLYVEQSLSFALEKRGVPYEVRYSPELPPRQVAIQRAAEVAGLAALSPAHLSIHPRFGPWIALRAFVVWKEEDSASLPEKRLSSCAECDRRCAHAFNAAMANCKRGCLTHGEVMRDWRAWLSIRDACPVGKEYRYSEDQIRYHYTKDRSVLEVA